jgi:molecular chaperone GrpE
MPEQPKDPSEPHIRVDDRRWWARGESAESTEPAGRKPTYVEALEQQLADKTALLQNYAVEQRRTLEEFEQVKLRIRRDVAKEVERSRRAVLVELLEVLDNLDRALASEQERPQGEGPHSLLQGVGLVRDQFLAKLQAFGVVRVAALGQPFNAALHEAVTTAPVDPSQDGVIVAVVKEGYAIGDDVLRPASVVVGKA